MEIRIKPPSIRHNSAHLIFRSTLLDKLSLHSNYSSVSTHFSLSLLFVPLAFYTLVCVLVDSVYRTKSPEELLSSYST
jgi:hypothetical protein